MGGVIIVARSRIRFIRITKFLYLKVEDILLTILCRHVLVATKESIRRIMAISREDVNE